nr:hypothetical protein [Tanacetum cinerariifolium]
KFVRDPNKAPDSSQRPPHNCLKCGNPVEGLYCRQCALLQKKLKEDPGENSSQSPPHIDHHCCYRCGDSLDGIFCQRCTCESRGNGAHIGYNCPSKVLIISNPEPFYSQNDPGENSSQSPPHIDHHCCYRCGDSLDGIFCQRCTCESRGNGAHIGYNCPSKVPIIANPKPFYSQNVDEFSQTLPSFHLTCYSGDENSFTYDSNLNFVDDSPNPHPQPPTDSYEFCGNDAHYS